MKEPRILLTGRQKSTLDVLAEELKRYGREILSTIDRDEMKGWIEADFVDFVVIGGGLEEAARSELADYVSKLNPKLPVHLVPRTPGANPAKVIPFVNELAVLFNVTAADGGK